MNLTNKYGLPIAFHNAVSWQPEEGEYQYRVSELTNPPRIVWLTRRHHSEVVEDISDKIWLLLGSAVHYVLDKGGGRNDLVEETLTAAVGGIKIKGSPDLLQGDTLWDYKITSVWSVVFNPEGKGEWQAQLNIYKWLYEQSGFGVKNLKICAILRDWQKSKRGGPDYPDIPVVVIDISVWDNPKFMIQDKLDALESVKDKPDNELPICTAEERWQKPDRWALMKKGQKRAVKLYDSQQEAENACQTGHFVEPRIGVSTRCLEYCSVQPWCEFGKQISPPADSYLP